MQEINLLQNKLKDKTNQWEKNNRTVIIILSFLLIGVLAAAATFYLLKRSAEDAKLALDQENVTIQSRLDQMEDDLGDAKAFQAQAKNIKTLMQTHVVWTNFFAELSGSTFKMARFLSLTSDTSGRVHIEGIAPDYNEMGKMLLALETADNVESVRLGSTSRSEDAQAGVRFALEVTLNTKVLVEQE
jgi:Tfp pilus assembly protein PilN